MNKDKKLYFYNQSAIVFITPDSSVIIYYGGNLCVDHPIIYSDFKVAFDNPFAIPKYLKKMVYELAEIKKSGKELYKLSGPFINY